MAAMRFLPLVLLFAAACAAAPSPDGANDDPGADDAGDDSPDDPPDDDEDGTDGGDVDAPIVACSYGLTARPGAEAPVPGGDAIGADPQPFQVHLGLGGDPRSSMAIIWRTDDATTATVARVGLADGPLDQVVTGVTFRYDSGVDSGNEMLRVHEVHLCGLQPDTVYDYQVGGEGAFSEVHRFRTAPDVVASPDAQVVVAYFGDSRGGWDVLDRMADEIAERSPDLLVITGDLVGTGDAQDEWDAFFAAAPELFASVPMISANGNHEANAINFYSLLAMPGDEENFSIDYGHLHQVVLNSDPVNQQDIYGPIADFLDADLTASTARWNMVALHKTMWSSSTNHGSSLTRRAAWGAIIDEHHVDMVVAGHDHIYERTKPMRGELAMDSPAEGTIHIVSGGAGAELHALPSSPTYFSEVAEASHNATVVSIRRDLLVAETFRDDGSVLDEFMIAKP